MSKAIEQSVADKPLQWLLVAGVVGTAGYLAYKQINPSKIKKIIEGAETEVSTDNPFSYSAFLKQKIPANTQLLKFNTAATYAKRIYDSLNTYFFDDEDILIGVFSSLGSKLKVAQVAEKFFVIYGKDILEYIKNGNKTFDFGTGGISNEDYKRILQIVDNKPKF
jgi:hypothetical protein